MAEIVIKVDLETGRADVKTANLRKQFNSVQKEVDKTNIALKALSNTAKSVSSIFIRVFKNAFETSVINIVRTASRGIIDFSSELLGIRNSLTLAADSSLSLSEQTAIANDQLGYAISLAGKYKVDMFALSKEYARFANAALLAGQSQEEVNHNFEVFTKLARITNMSGQQLSSMFLALEQMISKGFVSMEELRRQLGQYLPGAMELAAKSMGYAYDELDKFYKLVSSGKLKTSDFLPKFVEEIDKLATEGKLEQALKTPAAAITDLQNKFKSLVAITSMLLAPAIEYVTSALASFLSLLINIGQAFGADLGPQIAFINGVFEDTAETTEKINTSFEDIQESSSNLKDDIKKLADNMKGLNVATIGMTAILGTTVINIFAKLKNSMIVAVTNIKEIIFAFKLLAEELKFLKTSLGVVGIILGAIGLVYKLTVGKIYDSIDAMEEAERKAKQSAENINKSIEEIQRSSALSAVESATATLSGLDNVEKIIRERFTVAIKEGRASTEDLDRAIASLTEARKMNNEQLAQAANAYYILNDATKENIGLTEEQNEALGEYLGKLSQTISVLQIQLKYGKESAESLARIKAQELGIDVDTDEYKVLLDFTTQRLSLEKQIKNQQDSQREVIRQARKEQQQWIKDQEFNLESLSLDIDVERGFLTLKETMMDLGGGFENFSLTADAAATSADNLSLSLSSLGEEATLFGQQFQLATDSLDESKVEIEDLSETLKVALGQTLANSIEDVAGSIIDFAFGAKTSFAEMAESIVKDISKMILKLMLLKSLQGAFPSLFPASKGAIVGTQGLTAFASGAIVTKPTVFPMANGAGLMGEAGPEAIMPLTRLPGGDLGVKAQSSSAETTVNVNVINQGNNEVDVRKKQTDDGIDIEVIIKEKVTQLFASGDFDPIMNTTYGLNRRGFM